MEQHLRYRLHALITESLLHPHTTLSVSSFSLGYSCPFSQVHGLPLGTRLVLQPFWSLLVIISYTLSCYGSKRYEIVDPPSQLSSFNTIEWQKTNLALNVELSTFPYLFVTPCITQREFYVLNHIACVVLKQHYFSICCRGAASTAFPCVGLKKPRRAKKW